MGDLVQEDIYSRLKKINEDAIAKKAAEGTIEQKIAGFWGSGMDSTSIEKQGLQPLQTAFTEIDNIRSTIDLVDVTAAFHNKRIRSMFIDVVSQDDKNSEIMAYQLQQGGLGMPNRDYYFNTDARTLDVKKAYQLYLFKTFKQLGNDSTTAAKNANSVFILETKIGKSIPQAGRSARSVEKLQ